MPPEPEVDTRTQKVRLLWDRRRGLGPTGGTDQLRLYESAPSRIMCRLSGSRFAVDAVLHALSLSPYIRLQPLGSKDSR